LTVFFHIVTGVRQGCVLSPFLFLLVVDFGTRKAIIRPSLGIKWTEETRLTDVDFADDISSAETRQSARVDDQPGDRSKESRVKNQCSENSDHADRW